MSQFKADKFVIGIAESFLVITYIIFEELIWNVFAKPVFQYLKSLLILDAVQQTFLDMHRYLLLFVFILILLLAESLGILSGISIINGYIFGGIVIYAMKIPVAAFTFWLFDLTKDKLMTFQWLKSAYEMIMALIDKVVNSSIHIYIKTKVLLIRKAVKELVNNFLSEGGVFASIKRHYVFFKLKFSQYIKP